MGKTDDKGLKLSAWDSISNAFTSWYEITSRPYGKWRIIEWTPMPGVVPYTPCVFLRQNGVRYKGPFGTVEVIGKGKDAYKTMVTRVYVRETQYQWADYVLRSDQRGYTLTTTHKENTKTQPGSRDPMAASWGKPVRNRGTTGMIDKLGEMLGHVTD